MKNKRFKRLILVVLALTFLLACGTSNKLIEEAIAKTQAAAPAEIVMPTEAEVPTQAPPPTQEPLPTYTPYPTQAPPPTPLPEPTKETWQMSSSDLSTPVYIDGVRLVFKSIALYENPIYVGELYVAPENGELVLVVSGTSDSSFEDVKDYIYDNEVLFVVDDNLTFYEWSYYEYHDYTEFTLAFLIVPNSNPFYLYYDGPGSWSLNLGTFIY